jgi:hypothetical protein
MGKPDVPLPRRALLLACLFLLLGVLLSTLPMYRSRGGHEFGMEAFQQDQASARSQDAATPVVTEGRTLISSVTLLRKGKLPGISAEASGACFDKAGRLYVVRRTNGRTGVHRYTVDATDGALTPNGVVIFSPPGDPEGIAINPAEDNSDTNPNDDTVVYLVAENKKNEGMLRAVLKWNNPSATSVELVVDGWGGTTNVRTDGNLGTEGLCFCGAYVYAGVQDDDKKHIMGLYRKEKPATAGSDGAWTKVLAEAWTKVLAIDVKDLACIRGEVAVLSNRGDQATVSGLTMGTDGGVTVRWRVNFRHEGKQAAEGLAYRDEGKDGRSGLLAIVAEDNYYALYRVVWASGGGTTTTPVPSRNVPDPDETPAVDRLADALYAKGVRCLVFDWDDTLSVGAWVNGARPALRTGFFNLLFSFLTRHNDTKAAVASFNNLGIGGGSGYAYAEAARGALIGKRAGMADLLRSDRFLFVGGRKWDRVPFLRFAADGMGSMTDSEVPAGVGKQRHLELIANVLDVGRDTMAFFDESAENMAQLGWSGASATASGRFQFATGTKNTLLCLSVSDNAQTPNTLDFENMIDALSPGGGSQQQQSEQQQSAQQQSAQQQQQQTVATEPNTPANGPADELVDALYAKGVRCLVFDWDGTLSVRRWTERKTFELRAQYVKLVKSFIGRYTDTKLAVASKNSLDIGTRGPDYAEKAQAKITDLKLKNLTGRFLFVGGHPGPYVGFTDSGTPKIVEPPRGTVKQRHLAFIANELGVGVDAMLLIDEDVDNMNHFGWQNAKGRFKFSRGTGPYAKTLLCLSVNDSDNRTTPTDKDLENMKTQLGRVV